jgi:protein-tyrosine phosphatase
MGNNASHHTVRANAYYKQFDLLDNEPTLIINPFLYLGGMYARQNPWVLDHLGITHILNVAAEQHLDTIHLTNSNINVKHIPAEDHENYNIRQNFDEAFQFIEDALNTKNGRILVHCALGISRSPTIVIAYIMYRYGMMYQKAFQYVQNLRPNINPNNSFKIQLQDFEYELAGLTQQHKKQKRFSDNFSSSHVNINNFSLNGATPISMKGSKKNYTNMMNAAETKSKSYMIQNAKAPYYIDPASNHGKFFSIILIKNFF